MKVECAFVQAHTGSSVDFRYNLEGKTYAWSVPELHDSVTAVTMSRRGDRVTLSLAKASEVSWYELAKRK